MSNRRATVSRLFKYTIYGLLTLNVYLFFAEEWTAAAHRFADGLEADDIIEGFAASIDTAAWVILLLMFELETYVLDATRVSNRVRWTLHGLRVFCYAFIVYAFYGYVVKLVFLLGSTPLHGVSDLCDLSADGWAYAVDFDEYELLTPSNCASMSAAAEFYRFPGTAAVVDSTGLIDIVRLAWTDVVNSGVWLLVVAILEIDVRLQEAGKHKGTFLRISNSIKVVLYTTLLLAAIYWGMKGDFVDFWDAFLWLVAFVFIELNVFDWRHEALDQQAAARAAGPA